MELVTPQADLPPLPPSLWLSWDIKVAVAHESPGAVIAIARRAHGLRQDELAPIAGFSQSTISRLESGGNLAYDIRVLRIFQRLLGIPPRLLGLADERKIQTPFDTHAVDAWKRMHKTAMPPRRELLEAPSRETPTKVTRK